MSFFFLLVLLGIFHSVRSSGLKLSDEPGRICSMSNEKTEPSKEALTFCTEYAESSCCSISEEKTLANDFDTYWRSAAGHCPGCLVNVKAFQCAYTCGPNQADFVDVKRNPNGTAVIKASLRMCNSFCNSFHSSCGNITVAAMEANNANAFCQGFVDSAKGLTVELNQYDCYNSPAAPNRCDGERFGEIEKPGTNLFFIISCIVLGIICTTLIVSVLCYTGKVEEPSYNQDDAISKKENNLLLNSGKASSKTV
mgnify:CR=1 FL=1